MHRSLFNDVTAAQQFTIDPYTNSIWLVNQFKVAVIENDGTKRFFDDNELGFISGQDLKFVFTQNDIYYIRYTYGLYSFTNYDSVMVNSSFNHYRTINTNADTLYIALEYPNWIRKFINNTFTYIYKPYAEILAKNQFIYYSNGSSSLGQYQVSNDSTISLNNDPEYLYGIYYDTKFSKKTDSLYVGGRRGISIGYNYDFIDTITPANTINMPSSRVLEMEFDNKDSLWAVFGDTNDVAFAIAKLEGNTWVNRFNASNCPIEFSSFRGLEIDTAGNLWACDNFYLHTLITTSSPSWLGAEEISQEIELTVFPNPTSENVHLSSIHLKGSTIEIQDLKGRIVFEQVASENQMEIDTQKWKKGVYTIQLKTKSRKTHYSKIVVN
ncbi:MAG: T9SS type A sorting domain-containing protein [Bacteroidota bacterium]